MTSRSSSGFVGQGQVLETGTWAEYDQRLGDEALAKSLQSPGKFFHQNPSACRNRCISSSVVLAAASAIAASRCCLASCCKTACHLSDPGQEAEPLNLRVRVLNGKRGLHIVMLYLVLGAWRVPWSFCIWHGRGTPRPPQLACFN
jgi:hypothetical protein